MAHTLQERYSKLIDEKLRASLVTKDHYIFNNRYEGNPKAGKVKIPVRSTEVVVGDYNKATGLALSGGTTTYLDLDLSYDKAVNEIIDGFDAQAVPDNIVAERLDSAGYSLASEIDAISIAALEAGGTVDNGAACTKTTVYGKIVDLRTKLSNANVPAKDRWLIVSPDIYALLLQDTTNFIRQGDLSQKLIQAGAVGQIAGFNVFECTRRAKDKTGVVTSKKVTTEMIAGHPNWCHRVEEWSVPVAIKSLTNTYIGASAVQGRKIFGTMVSNSNAVIVKRVETAVS